MGSIHYRAVHTRSLWRRVNNHQSLDAAINGKDGAAALFAGKARINYASHGDPRYVVVWEEGAAHGWVIKADPSAPGGIRKASVSAGDIARFEANGQVSPADLETYF